MQQLTLSFLFFFRMVPNETGWYQKELVTCGKIQFKLTLFILQDVPKFVLGRMIGKMIFFLTLKDVLAFHNVLTRDPEPDLQPNLVNVAIMQGRRCGGDQSYESWRRCRCKAIFNYVNQDVHADAVFSNFLFKSFDYCLLFCFVFCVFVFFTFKMSLLSIMFLPEIQSWSQICSRMR